jgi:hypothetical protein
MVLVCMLVVKWSTSVLAIDGLELWSMHCPGSCKGPVQLLPHACKTRKGVGPGND